MAAADPVEDVVAETLDKKLEEEPVGLSWEEQLVQALTWARTQPSKVAEEIEKRLPHYKGNEYCGGRPGTVLVTKEGKAACEDALSFLAQQEPMGGVGESSVTGLALAGEDHIADIGKTGTASHSSSDGSGAADRVRRYGSFGSFGECLWYGGDDTDARQIVLDLIIDDGVASRGHRLGIYTRKYDCVGVARGPHITFGRMATLEFACLWTSNEEAIAARQESGPVHVAGSDTAAAKKAATTQWKSLGTCPVCQEPIKGGRTIDIDKLGAKLHAGCFKCIGCACQLNGSPFQVHNKTLFCNPCYYEKHGEKCTACGLTMQSGILKCNLGKFHLECIVCSVCEAKIGKAPFSTTTGAIVCKACEAEKEAAGAARPSKAAAKAPAAGLRMTPPKAAGASSARARSPMALAGSASSGPAVGGRPAAKAGGGPVAKAAPKKAGAAAKPKARVSLAKAGATCVGLGMNYADL